MRGETARRVSCTVNLKSWAVLHGLHFPCYGFWGRRATWMEGSSCAVKTVGPTTSMNAANVLHAAARTSLCKSQDKTRQDTPGETQNRHSHS